MIDSFNANISSNSENMNDRPLISVIVPVYNAENYIDGSVESLLCQTIADIEIILVDDCSTDGSLKRCEHYARNDNRVHVHKRTSNGGIVVALNEGISISRGQFIARMDADDISLPRRFESQIEYLRNNPGIDLCGTSIELIDSRENSLGVTLAVIDPPLVKLLLKYCSPIAHPTWMMRRSVVEALGGYRNVAPLDDYDFLSRAVKFGFALGNVRSVGLKYRISETSVSANRSIFQRKGFSILRKYYQKGKILDESAFSRMITCSPFLIRLHRMSERLLQRAILIKEKSLLGYFYFVLGSTLCSPYQFAFFVDIGRKKMLIKLWPLIRVFYRA